MKRRKASPAPQTTEVELLAALEAELARLEREPPDELIAYLNDQLRAYPPGSLCRRRLEETIRGLQSGA